MEKNVINDLLNYNLKIVQNVECFKFSIDSVMLAEFVELDYRDKRLLDLCTGNAPIPLIMSKHDLEIHGIELQKSIYEMAVHSVQLNKVTNISLINDNVKNVQNYFPGNNFDIITCNPPYFKYDPESIINKSREKAIARHEIEIRLEEIIEIAYNNLRNHGKLYIVHRSERLVELIQLLKSHKFGIKRMKMVYYNQNSECIMLLIEAKKNSKSDVKIANPLFVENYGR